MTLFCHVRSTSGSIFVSRRLHLLFSTKFSTFSLFTMRNNSCSTLICATRWEHTWRTNDRWQLVERFMPGDKNPLRRNENRESTEKRPNKKRVYHKLVQGELIYGIGPCSAALKARRRKIFAAYIAKDREGSDIETIRRLAEEANIEIRCDLRKRQMTSDLLRKDGHQGICLDVTKLKYLPLWQRDPSPDAERSNGVPPLWLLLDKVQDPMNLGAILRSSAFFGVQKVVTSRECAPLTPVVSKASAGVMEILPIYKALGTQVLLQAKRDEGWDIVGTVAGTTSSLSNNIEIIQCENFVLQKPTILVFGNEGFGMDEELENLCTKMITIQSQSKHLPLIGLESLNVSVSVGVLLYSILRGNSSTPGR